MNPPSAFTERMKKELGASEYEAFVLALNEVPPVSIRYNAAKIGRLEQDLDSVKWSRDGFYLAERPIFTLDPAFQAGTYYVQEASSMFVGTALKQGIDLGRSINVLDLCAAPGGKTTLLASLISPDSLLLANEVIKTRVNVLKDNIIKWGLPNVHVCNHDVEELSSLVGFFDVILVDAPCSGEGMFRKDSQSIGEWSEDNVRICRARQKRILGDVVGLLAPSGIVIYSTCTYNDAENKDNGVWMCGEFGFEGVRIELEEEWGVTEIPYNGGYGYQFYPHKTKGEGFYLTVLKKKAEEIELQALPNAFKKNDRQGRTNHGLQILSPKETVGLADWIADFESFAFYRKGNGMLVAVLKNQFDRLCVLDVALKRKQLGVEIGEWKGKDFIPSHDLALSCILHPKVNRVELDLGRALAYLKRSPFELEDSGSDFQGWALVTYNGNGLGWMKVLKNRINNYLPEHCRIKMAIVP
jgi:16S rRNA C967 or C1407 C5-methylase (RsmB/RsmF family)/NOL1/NOP2/fmu family ribosome biogenesis protein